MYLFIILMAMGAQTDKPLITKLLQLAEKLDQAAFQKSRSIDEFPGWAVKGFSSLKQSSKPLTKIEKAELKTECQSNQSQASVRALAALWISVDRDIGDVPFLEQLLTDNRKAISFGSQIISQQITLRHENDYVIWEKITVSEAALEALSYILSVRYTNFMSVEDYQGWRAKNPDFLNSFDVWSSKIRFSSNLELKGLLTKLKKKRSLYYRVVLMMGSEHSDLGKKTIEQTLHDMGPQQLLKLLNGTKKWPEFEDPEKYRQFKDTVYKNSSILFNALHAKILLALWNKEKINAPLAEVAARLNPKERQRIFKEAIVAGCRDQTFISTFVKDYLAMEKPLISNWFFSSDRDFFIQAILDAVVTLKGTGLSFIHELLSYENFPPIAEDGKGFSPNHIIILLKAVQKLLPQAVLNCSDNIYNRGSKFAALSSVPYEMRQKKRIEAAKECLQKIKNVLNIDK